MSNDQFVALLLSSYCCILPTHFFFPDPCPSPTLEEEEVIHIDAFNSLSEMQPDFIVLVITANIHKYDFYPNGAALPRNSWRRSIALDLRSRAPTRRTSSTSSGKSLSYDLFFFV